MTHPEPSPEMRRILAERASVQDTLGDFLAKLDRLRAALARREGDPTFRMTPEDELAFAELVLVEFNEEITE